MVDTDLIPAEQEHRLEIDRDSRGVPTRVVVKDNSLVHDMIERGWIDPICGDYLTSFMWMRDAEFREVGCKNASYDGIGGISSMNGCTYLLVCRQLKNRDIDLLKEIYAREAKWIYFYAKQKHDIRHAFDNLMNAIDTVKKELADAQNP